MKIITGHVPDGYLSILMTLLGVMDQHHKDWCWVSQHRLLALMGKWEGVVIARSTLNVWLRFLESEHWIKRFPGRPINYGGILVNRATRYYLLPRARMYLKKLKFCVQKISRVFGVRFFRQDKGHLDRYSTISQVIGGNSCPDRLKDGTVKTPFPAKGESVPV